MRYRAFSLVWLTFSAIVVFNVWPRTLSMPAAAPRLTDACGRSAAIAATVRNALLFTPTIAEFLFVTRSPNPVISAYDANSLIVSGGLFGHVYPQLNSSRIKNGLRPGIPSTEDIFTLRPDVIFDWSFRAPYFAGLGLPALCVSTKRAEEQGVLGNGRLYAETMNQPGRADELISRYHREIAQVADVASFLRVPPQARILFISINRAGQIRADVSPLRSDIITLLGGIDLRTGLPMAAAIGPEDLFLLDPDIIVIQPDSLIDDGLTPAEFMEAEMWHPLKAVRDRRVYARPPGVSLYFSGIVETPLFARWIAEIIHPDFPPDVRRFIQDALERELRYTISDEELDQLLAIEKNKYSRGHERFEAIHNKKTNGDL